MTNQTRYERSVEIIKPLVYKIVWPNGNEELITGTEMLENGISYLNEECEIYEYEHVTLQDQERKAQLELIRQVANDLLLSADFHSHGLGEVKAIRKLMHELTNYERIVAGKVPFAPED